MQVLPCAPKQFASGSCFKVLFLTQGKLQGWGILQKDQDGSWPFPDPDISGVPRIDLQGTLMGLSHKKGGGYDARQDQVLLVGFPRWRAPFGSFPFLGWGLCIFLLKQPRKRDTL